jgi:hypothetical protein
MGEHHPDAETVLTDAIDRATDEGCGCCPNTTDAYVTHVLAALSAAGLVVIEDGTVPPWMEKAGAYIDDETVHRENGQTTWACLYFAEEPVAEFPCSRPLYVLKENPDG